jgi:uracil-DNA glycosylase
VAGERTRHRVYPHQDDELTAFHLTPYADVKVVILDQDPYAGEGQAHGLCFSVPRGVQLPPTLKNILRELQDDLEVAADHGNLESWALQGVLLLNTVLTVREGKPRSHRGKGWETFTDEVIRAVDEKPDLVVFVLWGAEAQRKKKLIDASRHKVICSSHPSPLAAYRCFFGSEPFSRVNRALVRAGKQAVDWSLTA